MCLFPHAFWVSLFEQGPASKIDAAGSACRGRLFAPSSRILCIDGPFLVLRIGTTAGPPHLPFLWRDTEGNKVFFWGVIGCLLRNGSLLRVLCSSTPLVATASARFVDVHSPVSTRSPSKAWAGGPSWAECIGMQPEGQRGEEKQVPVSLALWRCLQQAAPAWVQGSSLTKAFGSACYKKDLRKDHLHMGLW